MGQTISLTTYATEYLAVVGYLLSKRPPGEEDGFLIVSKQKLCQLLNKNSYTPADEKLKIWRGLRWIDADPGRLVKKVRLEGELRRMVKISLEVYHTFTMHGLP